MNSNDEINPVSTQDAGTSFKSDDNDCHAQSNIDRDDSDLESFQSIEDFNQIENLIDEMMLGDKKGEVQDGTVKKERVIQKSIEESKTMDCEASVRDARQQLQEHLPSSTGNGQDPREEESEDGIEPIPKRLRLNNQLRSSEEENVAKIRHPSEAAQSSCASLQIDNLKDKYDEPAKEALEEALEHFYNAAYRCYGISRPRLRGSNPNSDLVCRKECIPSDQKVKRTAVSRNDIMELFAGHVRQSNLTCKDLRNRSLMELFAVNFVSNRKFPYLCPACESFFKSRPVFDDHIVKRLPPNDEKRKRG